MNQAHTEFTFFMKEHRFAEAAALADRQSVAAGDHSEFWLTRLSVALRESGKIDGALKAAEQACAIAPGNVWAVLARAEALLKKGSYEEAESFFQDALVDKKTMRKARWGILYCLSRTSSWERILEMIARWELPPSEAHSWRAKALAGMGRSEDASAECEAWLAGSPDNSEALWFQAELWAQRDGLDSTISRFSRLAKIPGKPLIYGEIYASLCKRAGRTKDALKQYGKLLGKRATPAVQRKQAFMLAKSGQEQEAIPLLEELLRGDPGDMYLNNGYIGACTRIGDPERAWKFYHELLSIHPEEKTIFGRLSRVRKIIEKNSMKEKG